MTIGEDRVRIKFNPSADTTVDRIKQQSAHLIDFCETYRKLAGPEEARLWALAMTAYEEAEMWAVKAATTRK